MEVKGPFSYETFSGKYEEPNFNFFSELFGGCIYIQKKSPV